VTGAKLPASTIGRTGLQKKVLIHLDMHEDFTLDRDGVVPRRPHSSHRFDWVLGVIDGERQMTEHTKTPARRNDDHDRHRRDQDWDRRRDDEDDDRCGRRDERSWAQRMLTTKKNAATTGEMIDTEAAKGTTEMAAMTAGAEPRPTSRPSGTSRELLAVSGHHRLCVVGGRAALRAVPSRGRLAVAGLHQLPHGPWLFSLQERCSFRAPGLPRQAGFRRHASVHRCCRSFTPWKPCHLHLRYP